MIPSRTTTVRATAVAQRRYCPPSVSYGFASEVGVHTVVAIGHRTARTAGIVIRTPWKAYLRRKRWSRSIMRIVVGHARGGDLALALLPVSGR